MQNAFDRWQYILNLKYRSKFTNLNINICNSSYRWLNGFLINRVNSVLTSDDYKKNLYVKSTQWITINFIANGWMNKSEFYVTIKMGVLKWIFFNIYILQQKRFKILIKLQTDDITFYLKLKLWINLLGSCNHRCCTFETRLNNLCSKRSHASSQAVRPTEISMLHFLETC